MDDTAVTLLAIAAAPGAIAAVFGATAARRQSLSRRLRQAVPMTCRELAATDRAPKLVLMAGRLQPGPTGQLTSPVTQRRCLWWRVDETHTYEQELRTYTTSPVTHRSQAVVEMHDETGSVLLDGQLFDRFLEVYDIDNPTGFRLATHDIVEGNRGGRGKLLLRLGELGICDFADNPPPKFTFHEMRVDQYSRITVLGAPVRDGDSWRLTARHGGGSSTQSLETLLAEADREAGGLFRFVRVFTLIAATLAALAGLAQLAAILGQ
ncbi:hypothetical protein [Actinoplanes sp. NPDC026670]|uniref:hypothetical protein n=1 Tax=Actinoplanes sp. NPDC026670 TaxID=3154700 RepID=UPI0033DA5FA8